MNLSEAIRLGAMVKPQARGEFLIDGRTCAMGAALDATGNLGVVAANDFDISSPENWVRATLYARWPVLAAFVDLGFRHDTVLAHILGLNDVEGWTRERIADWVEAIERRASVPHETPDTVGPVGVSDRRSVDGGA